jgi:hypothetical protein
MHGSTGALRKGILNHLTREGEVGRRLIVESRPNPEQQMVPPLGKEP